MFSILRASVLASLLLSACTMMGEEVELRSRQADGKEVVTVVRHLAGMQSLNGASYRLERRQANGVVEVERCESPAGTHTLYCGKE